MKRIVVAGGGIAGKTLVKELLKHQLEAEVFLIEPKNYFEVPFAQLRALTSPEDFSPGIRKEFIELFPRRLTHIQAKILAVHKNSVTMEKKQQLPFDYLVLATGSSAPSWPYLKGTQKTISGRQKAVKREHDRIAAAGTVLIIGGGPVGVETAGEIAARWPEKQIMLVQKSGRLLPQLGEQSSQRAALLLADLGVKVLTGSGLMKDAEENWADEDGRRYQADLVINATGMVPNTSWARKSEPVMYDAHKRIEVGRDLRIIGSERIFAIGDISSIDEMKIGAYAVKQARLTAENLIRLLNGREILKTYRPGPPMGIVTIGRREGVAQLPFGQFNILARLKQRDLFSSLYLR